VGIEARIDLVEQYHQHPLRPFSWLAPIKNFSVTIRILRTERTSEFSFGHSVILRQSH
jgi:hypothetical protein